MSGFAGRLYRGEANLPVVARRKTWFTIAAVIVVGSIASIIISGFNLGIEFRGGNEFQVPSSVGTLQQAEETLAAELGDLDADEPARVVSGQEVGDSTYLFRVSELGAEQVVTVKQGLAEEFGIAEDTISDSRVSAAWGGQVTQRALLGLAVFMVLVTIYLVLRFEARMAIAAVAGLVLDLVLTAGIYSVSGFEVTPSTVVGFLTILGFALYDVVVVFDKIQENTRSITGSSVQTYGEAANLAINQTLMRSINTSIVALLPVGGLLFIGAGLLGAGTLKDLGLVLFVGMGAAFFVSIFVSAPLVTLLKEQEPKYRMHTQRVQAKRASLAERDKTSAKRPSRTAAAPAETDADDDDSADDTDAAFAGSTPKVGARPGGKRQTGGGRGGRPGGGGGRKRPSGAKRR
ncbi:protein translocase subunit SecF [Solwaraspora sp. WMMD406]|uniref:protein translocase subunit SecF n=1 Tax=Solwaraspora sp. WMMD406 TaxID=3016095 RepID=UPI0024170875|nr:protein translocase subunit SecF [Solwaraspora sp. WMMD406]MDG4766554.1 protein translocase subunit SecF [Solwaraspora sp. WMMD406]